eukprot:scaffold2643_cov226-Pinguiococcus_pyrenoidosus.AAC.1
MVATCGGLAFIFLPRMKAMYDGIDAESVLQTTRMLTMTQGTSTGVAGKASGASKSSTSRTH